MSRMLLTFFLSVMVGIAFGQTPVKNVVLVHGAFADGSGWEAVYKLLKTKGYTVSVHILPGIHSSPVDVRSGRIEFRYFRKYRPAK